MKNKIKTLFIASILSSLSACAFVPEQVHLQPQVIPVTSSNIGKGKMVAVQVIDARSNTTLGGRPSGYGPAASITLADNIQTVVQAAIYQGLTDYGFKPIPFNPNTTRKLTLRVIALNYRQHEGFFTSSVEVNSTIEATANNESNNYDHVYRGEQNSNIIVTPTSGQDSHNINVVFSNTLNQITQDDQLMHFLAK